jgi:hypothetical protein
MLLRQSMIIGNSKEITENINYERNKTETLVTGFMKTVLHIA